MSSHQHHQHRAMSRRELAEEERKRRKEEDLARRASRTHEQHSYDPRSSYNYGTPNSRRSTNTMSPAQSYEGPAMQMAQQQYQQQHQQGYGQQGHYPPPYHPHQQPQQHHHQQQQYRAQYNSRGERIAPPPSQYPPQSYQGQPVQMDKGDRNTNSSGGGFFSKFKSVLSFAPSRPSKDGGEEDYPVVLPRSLDGTPQPGQEGSGPAAASAGGGTDQRQDVGRQAAPQQQAAGRPAAPAAGAADSNLVRDLQHRISVLEAQVQEVDDLKSRLQVEQRASHEWKEKWNYQNFKLNLMVDMLVLRTMELEPKN